MTWLAWLDMVASAVSAVIAMALALIVVGIGERRGANLLFGLFAVGGGSWAASHAIIVLNLWLGVGNPMLWQQIGVISFGVMSVSLLLFAALALNRRTRLTDGLGVLGFVLLAVSAFPPLRHYLVARVWQGPAGVASFDLGPWGYAAAGIVALYYLYCLALFWSERRRRPTLYLSIVVLTIGLVFRTMLSSIPITSITAAISIGLLGYSVVREQFLDPLRELTTELERKVDERTRELAQTAAQLEDANQNLARRNLQMQTILDIGRVAGSIRDPDELLRQAVDLICDRFGYYFAGVFVPDTGKRYAELRAARGDIGRRLLERRYRIEANDPSVISWSIAQRQARIAAQAAQASGRTMDAALANTQSEITLPLTAGDRLLGILDIQSQQENAFGEQEVAALQGLANQLAVGLENALLFQETQKTLGRAEVLYEASRRLSTAITTEEVAGAITACIAETGADGCVVVQFEFSPTGQPEALLYLGSWRRDRAPLFKPGLRLPFTQSPFPYDMISAFWTSANVEQDETLPPSARDVFKATEARAIANIPLRSKEKVMGQIVVLRNTPGAFSDVAIHLYEMLSSQAGIALERAQLLEETQRRAARDKLISEIAGRISASLSLEQVLTATAHEIGRSLGLARVAVQLNLHDDKEQSNS